MPPNTSPLSFLTIADTEECDRIQNSREHILRHPDNFIGSVEKIVECLWVYHSNSKMEYRPVSYAPGLYKIFDEILVNAADVKAGDDNMDRVEVLIDQKANFISVFNTGAGISVKMDEKDIGIGAKLTNIFSTKFVIETADGKRRYKQVFTDNMSTKKEPETFACEAGDNWTKVSFNPDLAKFNMSHLEDDVVALMKRRVVDLAGCLSTHPGKKVRVFLNDKEIELTSFHDYAQLYLNSANKNQKQPLPRIDGNFISSTSRWQISVTKSEGRFQQVSFVNNINTVRGGTHVDYITELITEFIIEIMKKKNQNALFQPDTVKNLLWIFINVNIAEPAFDSRTKEMLTTERTFLRTACHHSYQFLQEVADSSGVVESLQSEFKQNKDPKKTDVAKTRKIFGIEKLEDATEAGGSRSHDCTLILTEGDSAKAFAMVGLSVIGRALFGVYPIRGKLLNVKEASHKQIKKNVEIRNIRTILGLKMGNSYDTEDSVKQLRYGHLMMMADQDHDGAHIKGLIISFIHKFWPSLLKQPSFILDFITPVVKAVCWEGKNKKVRSFYLMDKYKDWVKQIGADVEKWKVKYYKGLGSHDTNEARECFSNINSNSRYFVWSDDKDGDAIELAFSQKKIDARKSWLEEEEDGSYPDHAEKMIGYEKFVNKELKLFSRADLQRSIPSMVDGLKPTQRKILFCAFKRNLVNETKVAQFSGYVSENSSYHHGEVSIQKTIVGMAQKFVGSNNVNLLMPKGQFGTRNMGGKDAASARYIYTKLEDVTRSIFPKEDDELLDYLKEDGLQIEPVWYAAIIPMALVNGAEGIGTGWSTFIPNYNPKDIIANIRRLINKEPLQPMVPWYKNFKGNIQQAVSTKESSTKESCVTYTVTGKIDVIEGDVGGDDKGKGAYVETDVRLRISELPLRKSIHDYKHFLKGMMGKKGFIKDMLNESSNEAVNFTVTLSQRNFRKASRVGLGKKFKLISTLTTKNMHLFDKDNKIVKYDNPEQIMVDFYPVRLRYYDKRKKLYLKIYKDELEYLDNQIKFIRAIVEKDINVCNTRQADLVTELDAKNFKRVPRGSKELGDSDETAESLSDYDYLLSMVIKCLTDEQVKELCATKEKVRKQLEDLEKKSKESLWLEDLDKLEKALDDKDKREAEEASANASVSKGATKKPTRNVKKVTKAKPKLETTSSTERENPPRPAKGKGKAGPKKAPAKKGKTTVVESKEEDEDIPDLRARLPAHHLDSSPENQAVVETNAAPKQAGGKKSVDFAEEISGEEVASPKPVEKGRGGKSQQPAATKKRAPVRKGELIDEMVDASPDKKVRKTKTWEARCRR